MRRIVLIGVMITAGIAASGRLAAQQISPVVDIDRVRNLYVAAAYAEALAAIPVVGAEPARTDLEQYRALCLLALGREPEAIAAVERLVRDHPGFLPAASETTPRMRAIFAVARSKVVPGLARREYAAAKAAYEQKDGPAARAAFQATLDLIDSLADADKSSLADLRLLASEFLELSTAFRPAETAPAGEDRAAPPGESEAGGAGAYAPPIPIREGLPPWTPPDAAARRTEYTGLLRVQIAADGKVITAVMVRRTHPAYDVAALRAAKGWLYQPATRAGVPVAAQKDIQLRLVPR
jgi:TonB family protein